MNNGKEVKKFTLGLLMVLIAIYFARLIDRIDVITGRNLNPTNDPVLNAIAIFIGIIILTAIYSIIEFGYKPGD